jgi:glycosyltransferase involved in cell wall biosynthesis
LYGTVFENADLVDRCIRSLRKLEPYELYAVDNYSNDGTYEKLRRYKNIILTRAKCTRGEGRTIALKMLLKDANDNDPVMYIDLDAIYGKLFISTVLKQVRLLRHGELRLLFTQLSTAKTNKGLPWRNLNVGEDWERLARAKSSGIKIVPAREVGEVNVNSPDWFKNRKGESLRYYERERRYSSNLISHSIRIFKMMIDYERGVACKSFGEYYKRSSGKGISSYMAFRLAYMIAHVLGIYSYSERYDNRYYVMGFKLESKRTLM